MVSEDRNAKECSDLLKVVSNRNEGFALHGNSRHLVATRMPYFAADGCASQSINTTSS